MYSYSVLFTHIYSALFTILTSKLFLLTSSVRWVIESQLELIEKHYSRGFETETLGSLRQDYENGNGNVKNVLRSGCRLPYFYTYDFGRELL